MIRGIGIDIVSVERIERAMNRHGSRFTDRIFTPRERDYCLSRKRSFESFAARFAVKEAAFKALGHGWDESGGFSSIEVINDPGGRPSILFHGNAGRYFRESTATRALVTITHDSGVAAAVVVLEE